MENEKLTTEEMNAIRQFVGDVDENACAQIWTHINDAASQHETKEDTTSFWRAKGLSVRASNCLAKADIPDEEHLIDQFTALDDVLALKNCGRLTADEIWTFITARQAGLDRVDPPVSYENLSNRAQNALARQGIRDENQLLERGFTREEVFGLRGVGRQTCDEIWRLIQELQSQDTSSLAEPEPTQDQQLEIQLLLKDAQDLQRDIPLLEMEVTQQTWEQLQKTSVYQIPWRTRTLNAIDQQGVKTLADLAQISAAEWLTFKNFGHTSLVELKQKIGELIDDPEALESLSSQREIPLLDVTVSEEIFNRLQNTPIHQTRWSVRTENVIHQQGCQTLAEIASIPPLEWLKLKNFGRKSLAEIQARVQAVIENPLTSPPSLETPNSETTPPIQSLKDLGVAILQRLREREQQVIKFSYGYNDGQKTLHEIGEFWGLSRERVRQIKAEANTKMTQGAGAHLVKTAIPDILGDSIRHHLSTAGGVCSIDVLRKKMGWNADEQWLVNCFDEIFGEAWFCIGNASYEVVDRICYLKSEHNGLDFFPELVIKLQRFGYRPLTIAQCHELHSICHGTEASHIEPEPLVDTIANHPQLKVYQYGETYIGLKDWGWFAPEKPTTIRGQADLIEWYLRLTNEPASAKRIADEIPRELGNFRLTPFEVADGCESQPHRFQVDADDRYMLSLWQDAATYQPDLEQLLAKGSLPIERIIERLSATGSDETERVVAALNRYCEVFVEIAPFEWALKSDASQTHEPDTDLDITTITFEDLIPK